MPSLILICAVLILLISSIQKLNVGRPFWDALCRRKWNLFLHSSVHLHNCSQLFAQALCEKLLSTRGASVSLFKEVQMYLATSRSREVR